MQGHAITVVIGFVLASITGIMSLVFYSESNTLRTELSRIMQDNTMLKQDLNDAMQNLNDTKVELERSREELDSTRGILKKVDEELKSTRQRLSITEGELEMSRRDLNDARNELSSTKAKLLQAYDELDRSREEHKRTLRSLEELRADYDALKERFKSIEDDLKEYTYREDNGDFKVRYDTGSRYASIIDPIVGSLNSRLKLPYDIPIAVSRCGDVWYAAYVESEVYTRKVNKMVLCLDKISDLVDSIHSNGLASKDIAFNVFTKYILYHEVGHVVIRIADLHTGSREESLVDDFAFYMLIKDRDDINILIWLYKELARLEEKGDIKARHPSSLYLTYRQQYHDLSCLAYGAEVGSDHIDLGERDENVCKIAWYEVSRGWDRALVLWWK
ncbi:MAG: DUF4344 domain-containing metallopeptidase [Candidatus Nitrosocaldus sp.]